MLRTGWNLPPGANTAERVDVDHVCPLCMKTWTVTMTHELGGAFYDNDDDAFCPDCGTEGEYLED